MSTASSKRPKRRTARRRQGAPWASGAGLLLRLGVGAVGALLLLNLTVGFLGESAVFPLSPSFLRQKVQALRAYGRHRVGCLGEEHPPLAPLISRAERRHRLPAGLLAALVQVESEGRVHRISAAGAMGPAQLMPDTARQLGVEDPFAPQAAVDAGARYLAAALRRFGRVELAVAAYNAGPGAVGRQVPRNGETEHYVARVLATWRAGRPSARAGAPRASSR